MRAALACMLVCLVAGPARADVTVGPGEFWGPRFEPRSECRTDLGELGFADDEGRCLTGWDGTGEAPDAGGMLLIHGPPGPAPPAPPPREVHVALPIELYASLGLALLVGIGVIVQLARRRPPRD